MRGVFLDSGTLSIPISEFSSLTSVTSNSVKWAWYENTSPIQIKDRLQNASIAVTNKVPLSAIDLENLPQLKCICICATGADHVDLEAARRQGITVCNVVGYSTNSVAQLTIGLMINLMHQINAYARLVDTHKWCQSSLFNMQDFKTHELTGKILGIVGFGAIGKEVAKIASALGMKVIFAEYQSKTPAGSIPIHRLLPMVDVLSLHCPLTPATQKLINEQTLSLMKSSAYLINVARGKLIDEAALAHALITHKLAGAAVDVLAQEPPPFSHPLLKENIPNLIITPHIAWATMEAQHRLLKEVNENVLAFMSGHPKNVLT